MKVTLKNLANTWKCQPALRIALIYAFVAAVWIFASDTLLGYFIKSPSVITYISIYKGLAFVLITALLVYMLVRSSMSALKASESKYRILLENLPQRIFLKDKDFHYLSCNQSFAKDLGVTVEQIQGKTDFDFAPKELAQRYRDSDLEILRTGETMEKDVPYLLRNTDRFAHIIKLPIFDAGGSISGILGIFWDVTEKLKAEEDIRRYRWVYDSMDEGVVVTTRNGVILDMNPAARKLLGLSQEESCGRPIAEFISSDDHVLTQVYSQLKRSQPWKGGVGGKSKRWRGMLSVSHIELPSECDRRVDRECGHFPGTLRNP